jgi:RNA polymerase sigma-70 factor (ECF subfamily)
MAEAGRAAVREAGWGDYLRRCASRDESALSALYAAEVVMDVYKQVWEAAARFDERRGSAAAWIVVLARSRAMDKRRYRSTRIPALAQEELPEMICAQPNPESLAIAGQNRQSILRELAALPSEERQTLELAYFAGLSHKEVAERLGTPLGTVKSRIRNAVGRLSKSLKGSV